jgi:hypothetical protein
MPIGSLAWRLKNRRYFFLLKLRHQRAVFREAGDHQHLPLANDLLLPIPNPRLLALK